MKLNLWKISIMMLVVGGSIGFATLFANPPYPYKDIGFVLGIIIVIFSGVMASISMGSVGK